MLTDKNIETIIESLKIRRLTCLDKIDEGGVLVELWEERLTQVEEAIEKVEKYEVGQ